MAAQFSPASLVPTGFTKPSESNIKWQKDSVEALFRANGLGAVLDGTEKDADKVARAWILMVFITDRKEGEPSFAKLRTTCNGDAAAMWKRMCEDLEMDSKQEKKLKYLVLNPSQKRKENPKRYVERIESELARLSEARKQRKAKPMDASKVVTKVIEGLDQKRYGTLKVKLSLDATITSLAELRQKLKEAKRSRIYVSSSEGDSSSSSDSDGEVVKKSAVRAMVAKEVGVALAAVAQPQQAVQQQQSPRQPRGQQQQQQQQQIQQSGPGATGPPIMQGAPRWNGRMTAGYTGIPDSCLICNGPHRVAQGLLQGLCWEYLPPVGQRNQHQQEMANLYETSLQRRGMAPSAPMQAPPPPPPPRNYSGQHQQQQQINPLWTQRPSGSAWVGNSSFQRPQRPAVAAAAAAGSLSISRSWNLDNCAAVHLTGDMSQLSNVQPIRGMLMFGGSLHSVTQAGTVRLNVSNGQGGCSAIELRNVWYVPGSRVNLVSVGLMEDQGCTTSSGNNRIIISGPDGSPLVAGTRVAGVYYADLLNEPHQPLQPTLAAAALHVVIDCPDGGEQDADTGYLHRRAEQLTMSGAAGYYSFE